GGVEAPSARRSGDDPHGLGHVIVTRARTRAAFMPRLFLNVDHVATVRQARGSPYPDPVEAALLAESSGHVAGITAHLREDRRHVSDRDVREIRKRIRLPFNFEMSCAPGIVDLCVAVAPEQATLVPERREEVTTEGGLDL